MPCRGLISRPGRSSGGANRYTVRDRNVPSSSDVDEPRPGTSTRREMVLALQIAYKRDAACVTLSFRGHVKRMSHLAWKSNSACVELLRRSTTHVKVVFAWWTNPYLQRRSISSLFVCSFKRRASTSFGFLSVVSSPSRVENTRDDSLAAEKARFAIFHIYARLFSHNSDCAARKVLKGELLMKFMDTNIDRVRITRSALQKRILSGVNWAYKNIAAYRAININIM